MSALIFVDYRMSSIVNFTRLDPRLSFQSKRAKNKIKKMKHSWCGNQWLNSLCYPGPLPPKIERNNSTVIAHRLPSSRCGLFVD